MTIRDKVHASFDRIGHTNGTKCPDSPNNVDPLLHELFVAQELRSRANKTYDHAKKTILEQELFEPADTKEGETKTVIDGGEYTLVLKVANAATKTDVKKFLIELAKAGVSTETIKDCVKKAETSNAPAKTYTVTTK